MVALTSDPVLRATALTGWGRNQTTLAEIIYPQSASAAAQVMTALTAIAPRGVVARGMGRSYGDAAQCRDGVVMGMAGARRILEFDPDRGLLSAEAGATLGQITTLTHAHGWIAAVLPGTAHVSVGGAIAADVHGKNHPAAGTFSQHLLWLDLLRADGSVSRLSRTEHPSFFWATVGGMGLTGVIVAAGLQLRRAYSDAVVLRQRA